MAAHRAKAEEGDADHQWRLGTSCLTGGSGVKQDREEAFGWLFRSAEQGHAGAQASLGACYENGRGIGKDLSKASKWYRKAAEQGNADGQNNLGRCCAHGLGVVEDCNEAFRWFSLSAEQGDAKGQNYVGICYEIGCGVSEDISKAVSWYHKAATQGNPEGQYSLGRCYTGGCGVGEDLFEAFRWYRKAALQGHAAAQCALGECYGYGRGVARSFTAACALYFQSAAQGNPDAHDHLGLFYENGWGGLPQDHDRAVVHYSISIANESGQFHSYSWGGLGKIAEQKNANALFARGQFFETGTSFVKRDLENAITSYHSAIEHGKEITFKRLLLLAQEENKPAAAFVVGNCFENGIVVGKDPKEASKWYQKSAESGLSVYAREDVCESPNHDDAEIKVEAVKSEISTVESQLESERVKKEDLKDAENE